MTNEFIAKLILTVGRDTTEQQLLSLATSLDASQAKQNELVNLIGLVNGYVVSGSYDYLGE